MKDNSSKEKILIIVKGGVVQSIYASTEMNFDVLDFDNEDMPILTLEDEELTRRSKGLIALL